MSAFKFLRGLALPVAFALLGAALPGSMLAQDETAQEPASTVTETIQVTATRTPEDVETVPASVTVISGEELTARGVNDLPSALALAAGVSVAPGSDTGPAGSVPELWGLREFDAFLLVVDGVPWGGAFNPALPSVDLTNVERIEVLRGSAPVMYGATSFVGVIHIIHRAAGEGGRSGRVWGGNYGSGGAAFSTALPGTGLKQSITVDVERQGFKDDDTGFDRGHVLYRAARDAAGGSFHFDFDGSIVNQDPASPHVRQGPVLSALTPLDANYNPRDAKIDENRLHLVGGYDRSLSGGGTWSTTLSYTHSDRDTIRGFLLNLSNTAPNARGFEQDLSIDDVYLDTHVAWQLRPGVRVVAGFDHLYGKAKGDAETFDYFVPLSGSSAPSSSGLPRDMGFDVEDERNFSGLYAQAEWDPAPRLHFLLGARLNRTDEDREAGEEELGPGGGEEEEEGKQSREVTRGSGVLGVSWLAWGDQSNGLWLFADYRNTFKPAAIDFGPEAEAEILKPEDAVSYEVGVKNRLAGGRFEWEVSAFQMDFDNLVVAQSVNGLPRLVNAGSERFKGAELELDGRVHSDLWWRATYAWHDAKFRDFVQDFDGVATQLEGNRLEMSARHLGSAGVVYAPDRGLIGSVVVNYVGERFLNKRNTALAPDYTTWAAGLGYRFGTWEVRVDGENLDDTRPPVAESELGDAQYYRLPARTFRVSLGTRF